MQENPSAKTVRGLGLAVIILAILGLVALVASSIGVAVVNRVVDANSDEIAGYIESAPYEDVDDLDIDIEGLSTDSVTGANIVLTGLAYAIIVFEAVCVLLALIAGVLGRRRANAPERLSAALGMSVVAAVFSFVSGRWISMILLIVMCVFIGKVRSEDKAQRAAPASTAGFPAPTAPAALEEHEGSAC